MVRKKWKIIIKEQNTLEVKQQVNIERKEGRAKKMCEGKAGHIKKLGSFESQMERHSLWIGLHS